MNKTTLQRQQQISLLLYSNRVIKHYFPLQFQITYRTLMKLRNNSKNKENYKPQYHLTVILELSIKKITIKIPNPCPSSTLRQALQKQLQSYYSKVAYFQTVNNDWLADYKLQSGVGWIRNDLALKSVLRKNTNDVALGIDNYSILKCIGVGGFSKVYLVRDKTQGTFYAAKFIEKSKIKDKQELIMNQKQINEQIAFPFLVHMKDFIQTNQYYIMILDYCPGGQLFHLQRRVTRFQEEEAKKYFIEVLLAIEYLHQKNILYRDLKPQNIMIDLGGHVKITDFGLAKHTKEKRYSFCGSLEYMCPEVLTKSGHSFEVDYYCLGVLLYEMTVGCPPFYQPDSNESQTKQRILFQQVQFPKEIDLSQQLKNLIFGLLAKDPKKRLGHLAGAREIKCHPWIGWINRSDYLSKKIQMPYPVDLDSFNFDAKDITVSAHRMLNNIRLTYNEKKNKVNNSLNNKKSCKVLSPYREDRLKMKKLLKNNSTQKIKSKSPATNLISKKKSGSNQKHKIKYNSIKACYMSNNSFNFMNFFRFPTQSAENLNKPKQRKSYVKLQTECKQNYRREGLKKRKHKQQFTFMQVKRD